MKYSFCGISFDLMMLKHNHTQLHVKDSCRYFERCYSCVMWIPACRCDIVRIDLYVTNNGTCLFFSSYWTWYWHGSHHNPSSRQHQKTLCNVKWSIWPQFINPWSIAPTQAMRRGVMYQFILQISKWMSQGFFIWSPSCYGSLYEVYPIRVHLRSTADGEMAGDATVTT